MKRNLVLCMLVMLAIAVPASAAGVSDQALVATLSRFDQDEHRDLQGVVVMRDGRIVAERYYNGTTSDSMIDIRSAGKSITALLAGIAIDQGRIRSVDDPVSAYWPEASRSAFGDVSLRDILTMRSGLAAFDDDPESPGNEDRLDDASDPLAFVLAVPLGHPPGTRYNYNSATAYIAGVVVARATAVSLAEFARTTLFAPLGISRADWKADASGYTKGQGNLWLSTRGLATIGEMVRNGGVHDGRRIVSASWLGDALASRVAITDGDPYAQGYGYFWYASTQQIDGVPVAVSFASGNGGNKIYIAPSRRLVMAITSTAYGRDYGQRRSEHVLRAVLETDRQFRSRVPSPSAS